MKHFLSVEHLTRKDIEDILELAAKVKKSPDTYKSAVSHKSLVMIFQKTSTRTRISFEVGMTQLGGHAAFLDWKDSNFAVGDILDEVRCLGRYADVLMARVYKHQDVVDMSHEARVPVINGLSEREHPCQILADLLTIQEKKGSFNVKLAFIGDGNNICNSLIAAASIVGMKITVATPKGYEPHKDFIEMGKSAGVLTLTNDPRQASETADIIYTDTWVSLGQEAEAKKRISIFQPFQVKASMVPQKALIMHCLPAHRGYEITSELLDGPNSIVFDQSENRLHVQKAILLRLLGKE